MALCQLSKFVFARRVRNDVATAIVEDVYPAIEPLAACSPALKAALASKWTMAVAPPDETVLAAGAPVLDICYLVTGVCEARTAAGTHFDTLEAGSAAGHLDAILGLRCSADVVSRTYCTMYRLPVEELHAVLQVLATAHLVAGAGARCADSVQLSCEGRQVVFLRATSILHSKRRS